MEKKGEEYNSPELLDAAKKLREKVTEVENVKKAVSALQKESASPADLKAGDELIAQMISKLPPSIRHAEASISVSKDDSAKVELAGADEGATKPAGLAVAHVEQAPAGPSPSPGNTTGIRTRSLS